MMGLSFQQIISLLVADALEAAHHIVPPDHTLYLVDALLMIGIPTVFYILFKLVDSEKWRSFALQNLVASRIIVVLFIVGLANALSFAVNLGFNSIPVTEASKPHEIAAATTVKLDAYHTLLRHELTLGLSEDKQRLFKCVAEVSQKNWGTTQNSCNGNLLCLEQKKPMTKEEIITAIQDAQKKASEKAPSACDKVDIAVLK